MSRSSSTRSRPSISTLGLVQEQEHEEVKRAPASPRSSISSLPYNPEYDNPSFSVSFEASRETEAVVARLQHLMVVIPKLKVYPATSANLEAVNAINKEIGQLVREIKARAFLYSRKRAFPNMGKASPTILQLKNKVLTLWSNKLTGVV